MPVYLAGLLMYLFPYEVVAKMLVILLRKLASATTWTDTDDKLVAVLEERLGLKKSKDEP